MKANVNITGLDETLRDLHAIVNNAEDMGAINADMAMIVRNWQVSHFDKAEDSTGAAWKPLSGLTRALRGQASGNPKPLQDTGQLKASEHVSRADAKGWTVETRKIQAAVQQYGAIIKPKRGRFLYIPLNMRGQGKRAKSFGGAASLAMGGKRGQSYGKLTKAGRAKRNLLALTQAVIPAREFMYLNPQEREEMVDIYVSELASRGTTYIRWAGLRRMVSKFFGKGGAQA
jgi:phage gpG-like protein